MFRKIAESIKKYRSCNRCHGKGYYEELRWPLRSELSDAQYAEGLVLGFGRIAEKKECDHA